MTDFRALCVELTDALDKLNCSFNVPNQSGLVERARAALAEPEPEGPTDEELRQLRREHKWPLPDLLIFSIVRAVLARWGK